MSYVLGGGEATWDRNDGVWSYQDEIVRRKRITLQEQLPENAKVVIFHGPYDPWHKTVNRTPWIMEHYR
jgi:hypothetical protein